MGLLLPARVLRLCVPSPEKYLVSVGLSVKWGKFHLPVVFITRSKQDNAEKALNFYLLAPSSGLVNRGQSLL